jgi:2-iminobutanoate/2-iminopropanoate deaminase
MPYAPVIRAKVGDDSLFISGTTEFPLFHQHPHEHDKLDPPEDIREQTRNVVESLTQYLEAVEASWKDIVRTDVFLTDMEEQDAVGEAMGPYFAGNFPASTMVEVKRLVDSHLRIEVSAITVVGSGR